MIFATFITPLYRRSEFHSFQWRNVHFHGFDLAWIYIERYNVFFFLYEHASSLASVKQQCFSLFPQRYAVSNQAFCGWICVWEQSSHPQQPQHSPHQITDVITLEAFLSPFNSSQSIRLHLFLSSLTLCLSLLRLFSFCSVLGLCI